MIGLALCSVLASSGLVVGRAPTEGTCTLDAAVATRILRAFDLPHPQYRWDSYAALRGHALGHGWVERYEDVWRGRAILGPTSCKPELVARLKASAEWALPRRNDNFTHQLALHLEHWGEPDRAIALLRRLEQTPPEEPFTGPLELTLEARYQIGCIAHRKGDWQAALDAWATWRPVGRDPRAKRREIILLRAECTIALGRVDDLKACMAKVIELDVLNGNLFRTNPCHADVLVAVLYHKGREAKADELLARLARDVEPQLGKRIQAAHRHYQILQLPPHDALPRVLELLDGAHSIHVRRILEANGDEGYRFALGLLTGPVSTWSPEQIRLLTVVASSRRPDVRRFLEDVLSRTDDDIGWARVMTALSDWESMRANDWDASIMNGCDQGDIAVTREPASTAPQARPHFRAQAMPQLTPASTGGTAPPR